MIKIYSKLKLSKRIEHIINEIVILIRFQSFSILIPRHAAVSRGSSSSKPGRLDSGLELELDNLKFERHLFSYGRMRD